MKYTTTALRKETIIEDYIPLMLRASVTTKDADYLIYRRGEHSLLEIVFDATTRLVYRITLVLCNEYCQANSDYAFAPNTVYGDVIVPCADDIQSDALCCEIYNNAIRIKLSTNLPHTSIVNHDLCWELDENDNLASIVIVNPSEKLKNHAVKELSYDSATNA